MNMTWLQFYYLKFDICSMQGISGCLYSYVVRKRHLFDLYAKSCRLFRLAMLGGSIGLGLVPGSLVP